MFKIMWTQADFEKSIFWIDMYFEVVQNIGFFFWKS